MDPEPDTERKIRVVVVDDQAFVRDAVRLAFEAEPTLQVAGEARTIAEAMSVIRATEPDAIVLDYRLPDGDAPDLLDMLRESGSRAQVVVLTSYGEQRNVRTAIERGARAVLTKGSTDMRLLAKAVVDATEGKETLSRDAISLLMASMRAEESGPQADVSPREREVWYLLSLGKSNATIAGELFISERTVKYHVSSLLQKTGAESRAQLVSLAYRCGLMDRSG